MSRTHGLIHVNIPVVFPAKRYVNMCASVTYLGYEKVCDDDVYFYIGPVHELTQPIITRKISFRLEGQGPPKGMIPQKHATFTSSKGENVLVYLDDQSD
jgi:hypothetical protein